MEAGDLGQGLTRKGADISEFCFEAHLSDTR